MSLNPAIITYDTPAQSNNVSEKQFEYTGGPSSYYEVTVAEPRRGGQGYMAECGDIIEALGMDFNEGTAFKAIWRKAAARTLGKIKKGNNALYDSEKVQFYGERMVAIEKRKQRTIEPAK